MKCPYCDQEHPDEMKYCPSTGKELQPAPQQPGVPLESEAVNPSPVPAPGPGASALAEPVQPASTASVPPVMQQARPADAASPTSSAIEPISAAQVEQPAYEPPATPVQPAGNPQPTAVEPTAPYPAPSFAASTPSPRIESVPPPTRKPARHTGRKIALGCLGVPLFIVLLIALLMLIDPLHMHLWGRVNGTYDAAAEVMPTSTSLYLGINIGNALLTRVDQKFVVATPEAGATLPPTGGFQNMPANPAARQQITLPTDFLTSLEESLGIKMQDLTPWIGQYGGIAVVDVAPNEFGVPEPGGWVVAVESRNNRQADAFLEKIAANLAANKGLDFRRDVYAGVNLFVQDVPDSDHAISFGRSGRMLLFAPSFSTLRQVIDGQGKPALTAGADYKKLVSYRPNTWSASVYISREAIGDALETMLPNDLASSALDSVMPFAGTTWTGTLLNATVINQGLRFDSFTTYNLANQGEDAKQALQAFNTVPKQVIQRLPQDTLFYLANSNFGQFSKAVFASAAQADPTMAGLDEQFAMLLGFSLQKDLLDHITGQWALYAVPSSQGLLAQGESMNMAINLVVQSDDSLDVKTIANGLEHSILLDGIALKSHDVNGGSFYELVTPGNDFTTLAFGSGEGYFALGTDFESLQEPFTGQDSILKSAAYKKALAALPWGMQPNLYINLKGFFANFKEGMEPSELESLEKDIEFLNAYEMLAISNRLVSEGVAQNSIVLILAKNQP